MNGQPTDSPDGSASANLPFHGTFHFIYEGSPSVLRIEQKGQTVSGTLDRALLSGTVDGERARGDVKNPATGQVGGVFEMKRNGDGLDFQLTLKDPDSGETLSLPAFTYQRGEPAAPAANLDPQLVGRWRYTWTAVSGDFTAASDTWLILNPDGTYEYGYTRGGAGGAAGSIVTDSGEAARGKWRAQDRLLQYQESGSAQWETFARYYVEGDTMMLTSPDGEKKLWYRQ